MLQDGQGPQVRSVFRCVGMVCSKSDLSRSCDGVLFGASAHAYLMGSLGYRQRVSVLAGLYCRPRPGGCAHSSSEARDKRQLPKVSWQAGCNNPAMALERLSASARLTSGSDRRCYLFVRLTWPSPKIVAGLARPPGCQSVDWPPGFDGWKQEKEINKYDESHSR